MFTTIPTRFRPDLIITETQRVGSPTKSYFVKNPTTTETFVLGEEELFLCRLLDGSLNSQQIIASFSESHNKLLTESDLQSFIEQIRQLGLLEQVSAPSSRSYAPESNVAPLQATDAPSTQVEEDSDSELWEMRFVLCNPERAFRFLATLVRPFHLIFVGIAWLLIPGFLVALQLYFRQQTLLFEDLAQAGQEINYLASFIFSLFTINILGRVVAGTVFAHFGGRVKELGIRMHFGILPRFFINRYGIRTTTRSVKLWSYCAAPAARAFIFVVGMLAWYCFQSSGTSLSYWLALMSQAGLISFVLISLPIRQSDVFKWIVLYFNLPPTLFQRAFQILLAKLRFRPLPTTISEREQWLLISFAVGIAGIWTYLAFEIFSKLVTHLSAVFPEILGRATQFFIFLVILVFFSYWLVIALSRITGFNRMIGHQQPATSPSTAVAGDLRESISSASAVTSSKSTRNTRWIQLGALTILVIVLCLPFPYMPGGELQLLPPAKQQIQSNIDGRITQVFFKGGDGQLIKKGTVVASMLATDINNKIQILQESIKQQQAKVEKQQAQLNKLVTGPRQEEVAVSQAKVDIVQQEVAALDARLRSVLEEVEIARKRLQAANVQSQYSGLSKDRLEVLYREGGISLQRYEEARKLHEVNVIQIEEARKEIDIKNQNVNETNQTLAARRNNLKQAQAELTLLLVGSRPEDMEAARQEVAAAKAELQRLRQELEYQKSQQKSTQLLMPFDGYLVDSYLNQKVGVYLKQGQPFAVAQDGSRLFGEIQIPEYDAGEIELADKAEVKLLLDPNHPFSGKVVAVGPATQIETEVTSELSSQPSQTARKFRVVIDLANSPKELKPGMSGYAKVDAGKKPLFELLTRPLVRFIQIEAWSWLP